MPQLIKYFDKYFAFYNKLAAKIMVDLKNILLTDNKDNNTIVENGIKVPLSAVINDAFSL